jgi:hypothetical protein
MYRNGDGVDVNYKKAIEWYEKAAEQGDAGAQYNLGVMYRNGDGVDVNYKKAIECEAPCPLCTHSALVHKHAAATKPRSSSTSLS